jgi:hypothetical protein
MRQRKLVDMRVALLGEFNALERGTKANGDL